MNNTPVNRIKSLDGIRGFAILLVLLFHYLNNPLSESNNIGLFGSLLSKITYFGWVGVDLFFVLSGFLIGGILLANRDKKSYFRTFYWRRALRILPPYYLLLFLFLVLNYFIGNPDYYIFEKPLPMWSYWTFTQNFIMGWQGHLGPEGITPTWSLAIEEQFYLLCPLLVWFVAPRHLPWYLLVLIVIAPISRGLSNNWYQSYVWFHCRVDSISIGVLLAWLWQYRKEWLVTNIKSIRWLMSISLVTLVAIELLFGSLGVLKHTLFAVLFSLLILIVLIQPTLPLSRLFETKMMVFFGTISYSLYLFHNLINGVLHQVILNNQKPLLNNMNDLVVSIGALMISILLAKILHQILEQPLINIGKRRSY